MLESDHMYLFGKCGVCQPFGTEANVNNLEVNVRRHFRVFRRV